MIYFKFSGLSYQDSDYLNEFYTEGYLDAISDHIVPITADWNSEKYKVQNIFYDAYKFTIRRRDSEYRQIQKLHSASSFSVQQGNDIYVAELIDIKPTPLANEFWDIEITFYDKNSRRVENPILNKTVTTFIIKHRITSAPVKYFTKAINLPLIDDSELTRVIADEAVYKIPDYSKSKIVVLTRLHLSSSELRSMDAYIKHVSILSNSKIIIDNVPYFDFDILSKEYVGYDMYIVDFALYEEITVTAN